MPFDPRDVLAEVQGQRAESGQKPAENDFACPYIGKRCPKRSTSVPKTDAYPVCSLWKNTKEERDPTRDLICVCPKRFYQVDWLAAVVENCWPFDPPKNPVVATEVKMKGFGNVDFVIADQADDGSIGNFLSVELQAIDITGSAFPAYRALLDGEQLPKRPTYNFNWDNVYKRYITQLIRKGYFHHHWGTKIIAVIQDQVYDYVIEKAAFMRTENISDSTVNIVFMTYVFEDDPDRPGEFRPALRRIEGTSHSSLQQAILYKEAPSKAAFKEKIADAINR